MSQAKGRKAEIEALKRLGPRIDLVSNNPEPAAAVARRLHALLETAKQDGNVDPVLCFLHAKLNITRQELNPIPVACKMGFSHCCHSWVSATAPELFFMAKIVRTRGDATPGSAAASIGR